jgi:hypothetical protein
MVIATKKRPAKEPLLVLWVHQLLLIEHIQRLL